MTMKKYAKHFEKAIDDVIGRKKVCWKKGKYSDKTFITFYDNKRNIINIGTADRFGAFGGKNIWRISINGKIKDKTFKTKSQALAYAKEYMRRN